MNFCPSKWINNRSANHTLEILIYEYSHFYIFQHYAYIYFLQTRWALRERNPAGPGVPDHLRRVRGVRVHGHWRGHPRHRGVGRGSAEVSLPGGWKQVRKASSNIVINWSIEGVFFATIERVRLHVVGDAEKHFVQPFLVIAKIMNSLKSNL